MPRGPNRFQTYIDEAEKMAEITPEMARAMVDDYRNNAPDAMRYMMQGSRPRMDRSGELPHFTSRSLDFRVHKYQIQKTVPLHMRETMPVHELKEMAKRAIAGNIGDMVVSRIADVTVREDMYRDELIFTAEFYAIPPQAIKELYGETLRVPNNTQPPPVVRERTQRVEVEKKVLPMEYATDELVNKIGRAHV